MVALRERRMDSSDKTSQPSDRTLLNRYRRGDGDAATELYLRYAERLKALAHAKASNQLQREVDYIRAQRILDSMLQSGLISLSEFNKITTLNRQSFSPALAQIMPENR